MSRQPLVAGWRGAKFGSADFGKYVNSWEDTREQRGPVHRYNKRDGGEAEPMGREPHRAVVHCSFVGPTWRADFLALQSVIDDNPVQVLVHPVYGAMVALARSSAGRMDVENAPNFYDVTLTFEESQVDTNVAADQAPSAQGPSTRQQAVTTQIVVLSSTASNYLSAATSVSSLNTAASTYAAAAVASAQTQVADPTLPQQLAGVLASTNAAIAALVADPNYAPGTSDPAIAAAELLYDLCAQLADAVMRLRPTLKVFVTPMMFHLTNLARYFYGPTDGPLREAEILANNVGVITDPGFIPAGTSLLMAPPTVLR